MNKESKGRGVYLEKTMSAEERIRRAEEIYQNRNRTRDSGVRVSTSQVKTNEKPEYGLYKKLILQILICLVIYFIFYLIKNSNYLFSEDVIRKTKELLSYDINFQNVYQSCVNFYEQHLQGWLESKGATNTQTNALAGDITNTQEEPNTVAENVTNEEINEQQNIESEENQTTQETGGIGGAEETQPVTLSQMEIDANEIKANYSFILPLKGTVTSRYGPREATEIISANHAGIDIGANAGTVIVAAMEGTVTDVSSQGDYGNHVYIQNGDVVTLYAHCQTIYVKKGDAIAQGQQIAEVGSTGRATGPHLHFEIRKAGRTVNPEYVLSFT